MDGVHLLLLYHKQFNSWLGASREGAYIFHSPCQHRNYLLMYLKSDLLFYTQSEVLETDQLNIGKITSRHVWRLACPIITFLVRGLMLSILSLSCFQFNSTHTLSIYICHSKNNMICYHMWAYMPYMTLAK